MAGSFGWDWGPDLAGVGIWRSIGIESWSGVRLASVRPLASLTGPRRPGHPRRAGVGATPARASRPRGQGRRRRGPREVLPGQTAAVVSLDVPDVELWWPRGYGDQPRYDVTVELAVDGQRLATWRGRVGFRTAALSTARTTYGTAFVLVVNGKPIYVRGANWIPDDAFLTRLDRRRTSERSAMPSTPA